MLRLFRPRFQQCRHPERQPLSLEPHARQALQRLNEAQRLSREPHGQ
jgi:hypothetical protein